MKKVLFLATHPLKFNGYAKIGNKITNYLADFYDIYYFGFSNYDNTSVEREIHPNIKIIDVVKEERARGIKEEYGIGIIEETIERINPDIVIIYNDIIVTCNHLNYLNKLRYNQGYEFKVINYLDLVYEYEKPLYVDFVSRHTDLIIVFSECWKSNLIKMGVDGNKIKICYHGIDEHLVKLDKQECRKSLNLNENDFIILNCNRNCYRKATYLTIDSFIKFLKKNEKNPNLDNIKLFLHCEMTCKTGYNIVEICQIQCLRNDFDFDKLVNHHIIYLGENRLLSDEGMNRLYNACDVGINTCVGEGFGLCSFEHIYLGKPQAVTHTGAHKDIFKGYNEFTINPITDYYISSQTDDHVGFIEICNPEDFAQKLDTLYKYYKKYEIISQKFSNNMMKKYSWESILKDFKEFVDSS
jgi:glycosyltransferase involved in cell wall biosynthesis